jgi:hypothetical protein
VTVISILQIVFGSLGLFSTLVCGPLGIYSQQRQAEEMRNNPAFAPGQPAHFQVRIHELQAEQMRYAVYGLGVSAVLFGLMLFSGIGMLRLRQWARTAAILGALLGIAQHVTTQTYTIFVSYPRIREAEREMYDDLEQQAGRKLPFRPPGAAVGLILAFMMALAACAYSATVVVLLTRKEVADAFAGRGPMRLELAEVD